MSSSELRKAHDIAFVGTVVAPLNEDGEATTVSNSLVNVGREKSLR